MLLVRSYRTFAPLLPANRPSAVCFSGTLLTVTRIGVATSWPWGPDFLSRLRDRRNHLAFSGLIMPRGHNSEVWGCSSAG